MDRNPLGQSTVYPENYDPDLLFPIARSESRAGLGIASELPFFGGDLWNAWELSWLDATGKPAVATAQFEFGAESPCIIESKSLKLYLNSLAMHRLQSVAELEAVLVKDLSRAAGSAVTVRLQLPADWPARLSSLPGQNIDDQIVDKLSPSPDATQLVCRDDAGDFCVHSHLLRSNCPVTNQPDSGSIVIQYSGRQIAPDSLLSYLVSYRQHSGFHEACVEQIFMDLLRSCSPQALTVVAYYNRRGGLDINPYRSTVAAEPAIGRLWRQ